MKRALRNIYLTSVYLFLYVPILILIIYSFNDSKYSTNWQGFTLKWYTQLFTDSPLKEALVNSIIIALSSSVIATILGTLGALAFYRYRFIGRKVLYTFIYIVMMSPDIVMGISLLMFFITIGMATGALHAAARTYNLLPAVRYCYGLFPHQRVRPQHHRRGQRPGRQRAPDVQAHHAAPSYARHHRGLAFKLHPVAR